MMKIVLNNETNGADYSSLGIDIICSGFDVVKDYALVTSANVFPGSDKFNPAQCLVDLELKRISDGLESALWVKGKAEDIRKFLDIAKKDATIDYLKGKVIEAYYDTEGAVMQVRINKYSFMDK